MAQASAATISVVSDGGFEAGTSGFAASASASTAVRKVASSTYTPIAGTASLQGYLGGAWNKISLDYFHNNKASSLVASARIRADQSGPVVNFCADAFYSGGATAASSCVPASTTVGSTVTQSITLYFDPTRTLVSLRIYFMLQGTTGARFSVDTVTGVLTTPAPGPSPTPTPTVSPTPSPTPTVSPTPSPTPTVSPTPSPTPTVSPTPSPTPTVSPTPTPSPTPTSSPVTGKTYQVGPGRLYTSLQQVVNLLAPGDLVLLDGGTTYTGGARFSVNATPSNKITIRGVRSASGARPVLSGGANTIEAAGDHYVFEGLELTAGTSRCFFHHAHNVTLRDAVVRGCNAQGILGADSDSGSFTMEYVEVYGNGNGTQNHPIYLSSDQVAHPGSVFRMQHCYVHDNNGGNAVKSRAERNEIYYNWIDASLYRALELIGADADADGVVQGRAREDSDVVGNVLRQTKSFPMIRVGGDLPGNATYGRYRFVHNTMLTTGSSAIFQLYTGVDSVEMHGNVIHRTDGAPRILDDSSVTWNTGRAIGGSNNWVTSGATTVPSEWTGTRTGSNPGFVNLAGLNLALAASSPVIDQGNLFAAISPAGHPFPGPLSGPGYLPPMHVIQAAGGAQARPVHGAIDLGAFEY